MKVLKRLKLKASINSEPNNCEVSLHFDMSKLDSSKLMEIENLFNDLGIHFDKGVGNNVRDWEWDWSLTGPVSVTLKKVNPILTTSGIISDRVKALRDECYGYDDETRYPFVAYLTSKGHKWETLIVKDRRFGDYVAVGFMNGRAMSHYPLDEKNINDVNKWIEKYIKMCQLYDKINYQKFDTLD